MSSDRKLTANARLDELLLNMPFVCIKFIILISGTSSRRTGVLGLVLFPFLYFFLGQRAGPRPVFRFLSSVSIPSDLLGPLWDKDMRYSLKCERIPG